MPQNKSALRRYLVILKTLKFSNVDHAVSKLDLIRAVRTEMGIKVSESTIEKDLYALRHDQDLKIYAPIKSNYSMSGICRRMGSQGYYLEYGWDLFENWRQNWNM